MSTTSRVGYDFYFYDQTENSRLVVFPITPSKLEVSVGSRNETVELINEGQVNILKSPALIDIEFEARFPSVKYPFSREPEEYETYFAVFNSLKENRIPFRFIMVRSNAGQISDSNYNILCTIEEMKITEDANEGNDILVSFKLRQWKPYGLRVFQIKGEGTTTSTSANPRTVLTPVTAQMYTVTSTDTLSIIAKKFYDKAELWERIYEANKDIIEAEAQKHGKRDSQHGDWIFEGTVLTIPIKG